jgi:hypothetical protein
MFEKPIIKLSPKIRVIKGFGDPKFLGMVHDVNPS